MRRVSGDARISGELDEDVESRSASPSLLGDQEPRWRMRTIGVWGVRKEVTTPNTRRFKGYLLSRLLERFPFLVECWYWALIYWVSCAISVWPWGLLTFQGIPIRTSSDSSLDCRRDRPCCTKPRPQSHRCRGEAAHILGTGYSAILHAEPVCDDLDQPNLFVHPYSRLHRFSRLAFLLHQYKEQDR